MLEDIENLKSKVLSFYSNPHNHKCYFDLQIFSEIVRLPVFEKLVKEWKQCFKVEIVRGD